VDKVPSLDALQARCGEGHKTLDHQYTLQQLFPV
jgi:hypothetical protein